MPLALISWFLNRESERNNALSFVWLLAEFLLSFLCLTFLGSSFLCFTFLCFTYFCLTFLCLTFLCLTFLCLIFLFMTLRWVSAVWRKLWTSMSCLLAQPWCSQASPGSASSKLLRKISIWRKTCFLSGISISYIPSLFCASAISQPSCLG